MDQLKRENEAGIRNARWAGLFAQAHPKEHERLLKKLLSGKPDVRAMTGGEIAGAMRAWVKRSAVS